MTDPNIELLSDYQHVRRKTEMYFGSTAPHTQKVLLYSGEEPTLEEVTWIPAIFTAFREIVDNALDEIAHGFGNRVDITYDESTLKFSVTDNGRGIPIAIDKDSGLDLANLALTHARAGRNFQQRKEVSGTHGIGASAVNFCSSQF